MESLADVTVVIVRTGSNSVRQPIRVHSGD
jgi:hypothetical protein